MDIIEFHVIKVIATMLLAEEERLTSNMKTTGDGHELFVKRQRLVMCFLEYIY